MQTRGYKVSLESGKTYSLMLENGDHGAFPVNYKSGKYPEREDEIALSVLNAEEMNVSLGDKVTVLRDAGDGKTKTHSCTVCGIYSDITNGGKTAKGCIDDSDDKTPPMWSIIYVSLRDKSGAGKWASEYQNAFASGGDGVKVIEISDYLQNLYGQTIRNIKDASVLTMVLSGIIIMVVTVLLMRLIIWKERKDSSLKKALGMSSSDIRADYLKKLVLYIFSGIVIGVISGEFLGQRLAGALLSLMGASGFKFVINPLESYGLTPALIIISAGIAAVLSLTEIKRIRAAECLNSGLE
jgi:putative ABC transport system permease protein